MSLRFINNPEENSNRFYSTFPSYGKKLAFQWDELRQDLRLINPLNRATEYENETDNPLEDSVVSAREYGEVDFHNKYRLKWNKTGNQLEVQKNTGTQAAPVWTVHSAFGQDPDGNLIMRDVKGVVTQVRETGFGGDTAFYNVSELLFDVGSGFYLTSSREGHPVVSFTQLFGRADSFAQTTDAIEWTINHNFNTTKLQVQVFDDNNNVIQPTSYQTSRTEVPVASAEWVINHNMNTRNVLCEAFDSDGGVRLTDQPQLKRLVVQDANTVNFYFDQARTGFALINGIVDGIDSIDISNKDTANFYFSSARKGSVFISSGASGAKELLTALTFSDGINSATSTQMNWSGDDFYQSTNATGQPILNLREIITITDGVSTESYAQVTLNFSGDDFYASGMNAGGNPTINLQVLDHGELSGRGDDDHTQYTRADGTRAFTGDQSMGSNKLTNLAAGSATGDAVRFDEAITEDGANPFTGAQSMGGNRLTNLGAPTADADAARLQDIPPGLYSVTFKLSDDSFIEQDDTLVFDVGDFSMSSVGGKPRVAVTASAGNAITFTDGVNSYVDNLLNVSATNFYLSSDLSGNPVLNFIAEEALSGIVVQETEFYPTAPRFVDSSAAGISFNTFQFYVGGSGGDGYPIISIDDRVKLPERISTESFSARAQSIGDVSIASGYTITEQPDSMLLVSFMGIGLAQGFTRVKWNGKWFTKVRQAQLSGMGAADVWWVTYAMINPIPGTDDIVAYNPQNNVYWIGFISHFKNVSQTSPFGAVQHNTDGSAATSNTVTLSQATNSLRHAGSLVYGVAGAFGGDTDPWSVTSPSNAKEIAEVQSGTNTSVDHTGVCYEFRVTGAQEEATVNCTAEWSVSEESSHVCIEIQGSHVDSFPGANLENWPDEYLSIGGQEPATGKTNCRGIALPPGTNTNPSLVFTTTTPTGSPDFSTGIYADAADEIRFAIGGTSSYAFLSDQFQTRFNGTKSTPAIIVGSDVDTGFFRGGSDILSLSAGGAELSRWVNASALGDYINMLTADESPSKNTGMGIGLATMSTRPLAKLHVHGSGFFENGPVRAAGFYIDGKGEVDTMVAGSGITLTPGAAGTTIASSGGTVTFKETESGGYSAAADTLAFLSSDFYIQAGGDGKPIVALVSGSGSASAVSEVFGSAVEWQMTHSLNSTAILWSAYDDGNQAIIPSTVDVSDPNTAYFYFATATAGVGVVIG